MAKANKKQDKAKQIELQNLIFGTNEKKLMVSPEFLGQMASQYISKRMKAVNQSMEVMLNTKSPKAFFTCYDAVKTNVDELIVLQKYHEFKKPIPSEFKKIVEEREDRYILAMINRVWKSANMRANFDPTSGETRSPAVFGPVLEDILTFREQYSPSVLGHVDRFYKSVYGRGIDEPEEPEIPEEEGTEETEENPEGEAPEDSGEIPAAEAEDMKLKE